MMAVINRNVKFMAFLCHKIWTEFEILRKHIFSGI